MVNDHRHCFVCCANTSLCRMSRAWVGRVMKPARMHPDPLVARHKEADDPMQTIHTVRIPNVVLGRAPVLRHISTVGNMRQRRGAYNIVIRHPRSN